MEQPEFVAGFRQLADRFSGFVLDQWGVLHNGSTPYPGAIALVEELKRRNKRMVLLSNSGRRASVNATHLRAIGFDPDAFAGIVTSGEVCWQALTNNAPGVLEPFGRRCFLFSREGDFSPVEGIDVDLVNDPDQADFIYLSWFEHNARHREHLARFLEFGPKRGLTMVCANPDRVAPVEGGLVEAPGTIAARYEDAGGKVAYVGKPHPPIYSALLNEFDGYAPRDIICVGDSMEHDIRGASSAGLQSCLVAGGIHESEIGKAVGQSERKAAMQRLASKYGSMPEFVAPSFSW